MTACIVHLTLIHKSGERHFKTCAEDLLIASEYPTNLQPYSDPPPKVCHVIELWMAVVPQKSAWEIFKLKNENGKLQSTRVMSCPGTMAANMKPGQLDAAVSVAFVEGIL